MNARFRADIEGLRALAVAVVLLFHYGITPFAGGFVGVDVFFVISGYLITSIIAGEVASGAFSVAAFCERRLRRLLPALLLVLAACGAASIFVFLPSDLRLVGASIVNAALFSSNLLFLSVANDYFAASNLTQTPFLHTWSLAVEGQFYVVYPLLLVVGRRARIPPRAAIWGLLCASFAASAWGVHHWPAATFYLLPSRLWELLAGATVALAPGVDPRTRKLREVAGGLGLSLILIAVFGFGPTTLFPGAAALLPCCGAALVIASGVGGRPTLVGRALGIKPFVLFGRWSYSLYLWHWPLLVIASYGHAAPLDVGSRLALLAATTVLAALSWRWVERPFIARTVFANRPRFLGGAIVGVAAVATLGASLNLAGRGLLPLARLPENVLSLANGEYDRLEGECWPGDATGPVGLPCRFGAREASPTLAVWGNSYARMWLPALDRDAAETGVAGVAFLRSKCPPLLDADLPGLGDCRAFNAAALDAIRAQPALKTVVLGANWFGFDESLGSGLEATLAALSRLGVRTAIVLAPPQAAYPVPRTLAMAALRHEPPPPPLDAAQARFAQRRSVETIEALRTRYAFTLIDPADLMCDGRTCALERDGHPVFYDAGHVTRDAALAYAALFASVFDPPAGPSGALRPR